MNILIIGGGGLLSDTMYNKVHLNIYLDASPMLSGNFEMI